MARTDLNSFLEGKSGNRSNSLDSSSYIENREADLRALGMQESEVRAKALADYNAAEKKARLERQKQVKKDLAEQEKLALLNLKVIDDKKKVFSKEDTKRLKAYYLTNKEYIDSQHELRKKQLEDEFEAAQSQEERLAAKRKLNALKLQESVAKTFTDVTQKGINAGIKGIEQATDVYSTYMSKVNTRLLGSISDQNGIVQDSFTGMVKTIKNNLATSPYAKQTAVIEKLSELVSEGIAYNVEQRAFLASVSDKIATTFDVANGTLLQLVRIQQTDTSVARLGMQASLTQYLNSRYRDTSYMSDSYNNISSQLLGATTQMGYQQGAEFEYTVQKWLGSLGSVGVSSDLLSTIASGLNMLGTGNVSGLASNESLQNLLVMAANKSGSVNYADILKNGLTSQTTNVLLESIVKYIQEIASGNNNVVKAQYANLFGVSMADMVAASNLSAQALEDIAQTNLSYSGAVGTTTSLLGNMGSRMHLSEKINNLIDNAVFGIGETIAGNALTYGLYKATDLVEDITGGIAIPAVSVLGSGIDLETTVERLIKSGIVGFGAVGQIQAAINSLGSGSGTLLEKGGTNLWNATVTNGGGTGFASIGATGINSTTSVAKSIGNTQGQEIQNASISSAKNQAAESASGQEEQDKITPAVTHIEEMFSKLVDKDKYIQNINDNVAQILVQLQSMPTQFDQNIATLI